MTITNKLFSAALVLAATAVVSGCSPSQQQAAVAATPIVVQTAETIDPSISPAVAKACTLATAVTSAAVKVAPTDAKAQGAKAITDASCGTPTAQAVLTANDVKALVTGPTSSNSGNSANWLLTTALPDALAVAKIAVSVAAM